MPDDPRITYPLAAGVGSHHRRRDSSDEWYTPPHVFGALGLEFDLDPCSPPLPAAEWIPAKRRISQPDDGLSCKWEGRVWLNPPYGRRIGEWVRRLTVHGDGVALVFSRTDTAWFQQAVKLAEAVCFLSKRLRFVPADLEQGGNSVIGTAGAPSVLLGFGSCAPAVVGCGLGTCFLSNPNHDSAGPLTLWEAA